MSFKAALVLGGKEYQILNVNFSVNQNTDYRSGKPSTEVMPGSISMEIELDGENIKDFWIWSVDSKMKKSGSIKFFKFDEDASMFELAFEDGFCTGFSAQMSAVSSSPMTVNLTVSSRVLDIDGAGIDLTW
ncbi:MAG: type VI secretion system tube protein TssD [Bacteroidota bacterium]